MLRRKDSKVREKERKKQAKIITEEEEDLLWQKGLLGESTPKTLLNTVIFYNGLYFALHSGKEHWQLRSNPCQIEIMEPEGKAPYLKKHQKIILVAWRAER